MKRAEGESGGRAAPQDRGLTPVPGREPGQRPSPLGWLFSYFRRPRGGSTPSIEPYVKALGELAHQAGTPVCLISGDGVFLRINGSLEEHSGYSAAELAGTPVVDVISPEYQSGIPDLIAQGIAQGSISAKVCYVHRDGSRVPVQIHARYLPGENVFMVMIEDLSRRLGEQERQRLLRQLLNSSARIDHLPKNVKSPSQLLRTTAGIILEEIDLVRVWVGTRNPADEGWRQEAIEGEGSATPIWSPPGFWERCAAAAFDSGGTLVGSLANDNGSGPTPGEWAAVCFALDEETTGCVVLSTTHSGVFVGQILPIVKQLGLRISGALNALRVEQERRKTAEDLQGLAAEMAAAQILSVSGSWSWFPSTEELCWSEGIYRIFQVDPAEPPSSELFLELVHPGDRKRIGKSLLAMRDGQVAESSEFRVLRLDGQVRTVSVEMQEERDAGGQITRYLGAMVDVTDYRAAQNRVELLSHAVDQTPVSIVITDAHGDIEFANPAFSAISGYALDEAVGRNPRFLKSGNTPKQVYRDLWDTISSGLEWRGKLQNRRRDGSLYWEDVSIAPTVDAEGRVTHYIAVKIDITRTATLEEQLREARQQLEASQRLDSLGRFAGGIAHDFNNLLSIIIGYASILQRRCPPQDPMQPRLMEITRAGESAAELTRKLLAFGRRQVMQPRVMNLNEVVSDMEDMLLRLLGEQFQLELRLDPKLPHVRIDPGQMQQVIMNLVANGRGAMPEGGLITIDTVASEAAAAPDTSGPVPTDRDLVKLVVTDSGVGMTAETMQRVFEPFFTTKEPGEGTGLGLSIVHGIVAQSGGRIEVESEPGRGSTFTVTLPSQAVVAADPIESTLLQSGGGGETILVVEDRHPLLELLRKMLEELGYQVLTAGSGSAALAKIEDHEGGIDLLLTDLVMPGMSGRDLASQAAERAPHIAVLFMSGYGDQPVPGAESDLTRIPVLAKPFSAETLALALRETLDRRKAA